MNKEQLQDKRFEELCDRVEKIHQMLSGFIERLSKNEDRIVVLSWAVSIIVASALGSVLAFKIIN